MGQGRKEARKSVERKELADAARDVSRKGRKAHTGVRATRGGPSETGELQEGVEAGRQGTPRSDSQLVKLTRD